MFAHRRRIGRPEVGGAEGLGGGPRRLVTYISILAALGACSEPRAPAPAGNQPAGAAQRSTDAPALGSLPKVDVHMHVALDALDRTLAIMDEQRIAVGLNASGGAPGRGLEESRAVAEVSGGRLLPLCTLPLSRMREPGFAAYVAAALRDCKALGARGLKISKYLGLGLVDAEGKLVAVDDPRLDVLFETAGSLGLPVLIHSGDPRAFFEPVTPDNERYDELRIHPGWSFHGVSPGGEPWPSWSQILEQHERRVARHPSTRFIGTHFGNAAEDPERVARMLRTHDNYFIDTAARVPEFGRHAAARMRAFFSEFQDRVLFGSDLGVGRTGLVLGSGDGRPGTRADARAFFERHWRYFESDAAGIAHPTPIQGRWTVDAIALPGAVLKKLYSDNAARLFGLQLPAP